VFLYGFALTGFLLVSGFLAVKYHLTDSAGKIDFNDRYFQQAAKLTGSAKSDSVALGNLSCRLSALAPYLPRVVSGLWEQYAETGDGGLLAKQLSAQEIYVAGNQVYQSNLKNCQDQAKNDQAKLFGLLSGSPVQDGWVASEEWSALKEAIVKDKAVIDQVSSETGVLARLIVSMIVGEQLRLFNDNREVFKQVFQPLKILGNEVQFSLGVAGIKQETAIKIENNLHDTTSPYYLGQEWESKLAFKTGDIGEERFERLTDEKNHYYSYLYTALFLKQVMKQWASTDNDISGRPEILATLFNLGFSKSVPKIDPQVGGSEIILNGAHYTFGSLAHQFYYSAELGKEFPIK